MRKLWLLSNVPFPCVWTGRAHTKKYLRTSLLYLVCLSLNPNLALTMFLVLIKLSHSTGFIFFTCKIKQI